MMTLSSGQGIGLMAVIAVSGSVALLALGRQTKLLLLGHDSASDGDGKYCCSCDQEQSGADNKLQRGKIVELGPWIHFSGLDFFKSDEKRRKGGKKHVRFSADVVEPCGDGKEYRRRQAMAAKERLLQKRQSPLPVVEDINKENEEQEDEKKKRDSIPANRKALYEATIKLQSQRRCMQYY